MLSTQSHRVFLFEVMFFSHIKSLEILNELRFSFDCLRHKYVTIVLQLQSINVQYTLSIYSVWHICFDL